jgi:predicted membrane protein (TIGR00267 family)
MMDEELHLQPVDARRELRVATIMGIATFIGHLVPLLPFFFLPTGPALVLAIVLGAISLFGVGAYSAASLVGDWRANGLRYLVIGLGAALIGFLIGRLFNAPAV